MHASDWDTLPSVQELGDRYGAIIAMLGWVAIAACLAAACAWASALIGCRPLRAARGAHWTERARYAYQARYCVLVGALTPPVLVAAFALARYPLGGVTAVLAVVAAFWASFPARLYVERRAAARPFRTRTAIRGRVTWWLVMTPHLLLILMLTALAPRELGWWSYSLVGVGIAGAAFAALGGTLRIARLLGLAVPAGPRLAALVTLAAERAQQPRPPTYELEMTVANAFAWVQLGALGVTRGGLDVLSDDELSSVLAHELGHLAEPRAVALLRALGMTALAPLVLAFPLATERHYLALALLLVGMIAALRGVGVLARRMEERADRAAHAAEHDSGVYARALETLYEANAMPAVMAGKRRAHPHLYDRLVAAGATPTWARPAPPSTMRARVVSIACVVVSMFVIGLCA